MIKIIAILAGVYLCIESALFRGLYNGHAFGADLCGKSVYPEQGNLFATHAYTSYNHLTDIYIYIIWLLLFFIAGKLIKKESFSQIISLPSILLALLGFIQVYKLKNGYVINEDRYFDLMRFTLQSDFIHIWLALALLIYQIVIATQCYFDWKNNRVRIE